MTKKFHLNTISFLQLYSFVTIVAYGWFFFEKCLSALNWIYLPIAFILLWQALFIILILLLPHKLTKFLSALLLIINAFVFYFIYAYRTPVDKIMFMNVLQTDKNEIQELLNYKLLVFLILMGIIPALWIKIKIFIHRSSWNQVIKSIFASCSILLLIGGLTYSQTNLFLHRFKYLMDYLPPLNYIAAGIEVSVEKLAPRSKLQSITQKITPVPTRKKPNIILFIMGETSRAANFSLNGYHRPTNEALNPYLDNIIYYPNVNACGTSTAVSVPCIFSVYDQKHFKIGSELYIENVLDIFKKAGYKVRWLDNDGGCKNVCDRIHYEEPCEDKSCLDDILLQNLKQKIEKNKGNQLIILHTRGSHGPAYHKHYDEKNNIYTPICTRNDLWNCTEEELVNVYDNTIHYVSQFIARTIDILKSLQDKYNPILIYTSDHGESLKEDGLFLHAAPYKTAPSVQKEVPMLVWLPQKNDYKLKQTCLRNNAKIKHYSHDNIFHSLLGLAQIKSKNYQSELDIFSGCRK